MHLRQVIKIACPYLKFCEIFFLMISEILYMDLY